MTIDEKPDPQTDAPLRREIRKDASEVERLRDCGGDWLQHLREVARADQKIWIIGVESEIPEAVWLNGLCFENGINTEASPSTARGLFERAARSSYASAQYDLALYLMYGLGGDKNIERAKPLLKEAAEQGHRDARYELGICLLENDQCDEVGRKQAITLLKQAAEKKHADALFRLAVLLGEGGGSDVLPFDPPTTSEEG